MSSASTKQDSKKPKTGQESELIKSDTNSRSNKKRFWLVPILLAIALFLPFFGEWLQYEDIGDEYVCCMPENYKYLQKRAERAKQLRPVSNAIIGGSIAIGMLLVIVAIIYFYRSAPIKTKSQLVFAIIITIIAAYILAILIRLLIYFFVHNDDYFKYRSMGDAFRYIEWYNPFRKIY